MKSIVQLIFEKKLNETLLEGDLEEAAKSVADAEASNLALSIQINGDFVSFQLYSPEAVFQELSKIKTFPKHHLSLAPKIKNAIIGTMTIEKGKVSKVISVAAEKGYGPLMYEIASSLGGWLTSDIDVKPGAEAVWKRFYDRKDVEKKFLKTKEPPNKGDWGLDVRPYPPKQDPLMYAYSIPMKKNTSKLVGNHKKLEMNLKKVMPKLTPQELQEILDHLGRHYFTKRIG
jgi:hypothetical protein